MMVNLHQLNEARWAACNTQFDVDAVPSMEKATEVADNAVRAYLGLDPDEWRELVGTTND